MDTFCLEYNNPELEDDPVDVDPLAWVEIEPEELPYENWERPEICECGEALDEMGFCDWCEE